MKVMTQRTIDARIKKIRQLAQTDPEAAWAEKDELFESFVQFVAHKAIWQGKEVEELSALAHQIMSTHTIKIGR